MTENKQLFIVNYYEIQMLKMETNQFLLIVSFGYGGLNILN